MAWPTFEDGRSWFVDQQRETARGRELLFVLAPAGRKVWVSLGDLADTAVRRETIAAQLLDEVRIVQGRRLAPPYPPPSEPA